MTRRSSDAGIVHRVRGLIALPVVVALLQLAGCANLQMGQPKVTVENAAAIRSAGLSPMAVGSFSADPAKGSELDHGVSIRTNSLTSPVGGSFAQYLRETLSVELASAGLLDPGANTTVTGVLSNSEVNAPIGTGTASLGARFKVERAGAVRYDKQLGVDAQWESHFVGAVAIPQAAGQYEALYRKLVAKLLTDPAFRAAVTQP